jgi:hypothetical protein
LLVLAVVCGCFVAGMGGTATADEQVVGNPDLEVVVPDNELAPGAETTLEVSLANSGSLSHSGPSDFVERVTTARGTTMEVRGGGTPLTVETGRYPVGRVGPGTTGPIPIRITVPENVSPGTYELPVRIRYSYTSIVTYDQTASGPTNVEYDESVRDRRTTLAVRVADEPRFEITAVESDARVGGQGRVSMTVENTGTQTARLGRLSVEADSSEITLGTDSITASGHLGRLVPGETRGVAYTVHTSADAQPRAYTLTGTVNYEDADGITRQSRPLTASFTPDPEWRFTVTNVTDSTQIGDRGRLEVTVRNDGPQPARAASLTVTSSSEAVTFGAGSPTSTGNLGVLDAGATRSLAFSVSFGEEAERRPYTISGRVAYEDADGNTGQSDQLTIGITPEREQRFEIRSLESDLRVGEEGTVTGRLHNRGPATARRPVVVLQPPVGTLDVTEPEFAIPTLEAGESARFSFDVSITDSAEAGQRQLPFRVRYRNQAGDQRESDAIDRRVTVRSLRDRFDVEPLDTSVAAGESTTMRLRVTNAGEERVEDVTLKAYPNDPLSSADDEAYVGRLGPEESTLVTIGLSAADGAPSKQYPLSADFEYTENGDTQLSDAYTIGVSVTEAEGGGGALAVVLVLAILVCGGGLYYWRQR